MSLFDRGKICGFSSSHNNCLSSSDEEQTEEAEAWTQFHAKTQMALELH